MRVYKNLFGRNDKIHGSVIFSDAASIYGTQEQSASSNEVVPINFNRVRFDTNNLYDASSGGRLVCKNEGIYLISATIRFSSNPVGRRAVGIQVNGSTICQPFWTAGDNIVEVQSTTIWQLKRNDIISCFGYQSSGTTLTMGAVNNRAPELAMTMIG